MSVLLQGCSFYESVDYIYNRVILRRQMHMVAWSRKTRSALDLAHIQDGEHDTHSNDEMVLRACSICSHRKVDSARMR